MKRGARCLLLFIAALLLAVETLLTGGCGQASLPPSKPTPSDTSTPTPAPVPPSTQPQPDSPFTVTFFNVGQGDAALLSFQSSQSPGGRVNVLIDTATEQAARSTLIPELQGLGITSFDAVVVTHMDSDHSGGLFPVLDSFQVREMVLSGFWYSTEEEYYFIQRIQPYYVTPRFPLAGDFLAWGPEVTVEVLNPAEPYYLNTGADENNNSVVLEVTYGSTRFLFPGDIEKEAEERLACDFAGRVDLMKVPHHGSNGSSTPGFLAAFRPVVSVISCGRDNPYGHPSPKAVSRLEAYGRVLRTDTQGNVYVTSDGQAVQVSTER